MPDSYARDPRMRTTLNIDDELLEQATALTGLNEKTALVRDRTASVDRARDRAPPGESRRKRPGREGAAAASPARGRADGSRRHVRLDRSPADVTTSGWPHTCAAEVIVHPFVIGEMALGVLRRRTESLGLLVAHAAGAGRVARRGAGAHRNRGLSGKGIGYVDAHLLASALLAGASLWTRDKPTAGGCVFAWGCPERQVGVPPALR